MKAILISALAATAVLASAAPAAAQPYGGYPYRDGYGRYDNRYAQAGPRYQRGYRSGSATDRNGDGFDDRDRNFDRWIDPSEERAGRYWR